MRFRLVVTCVAVFVGVTLTTVPVAPAPQNNGQANASTDNAVVVQQMAAMPLAFTENRGQWDERVRFRASAGGATLWFCRDGITYQFTHRVPRSKAAGTEPLAAGIALRSPLDRAEADSIETAVVHATFVGGDPNVKLVGDGQLEYRCNYFLGNDHARWRTDVPNYGAVIYHGVYPGVDVRFEGRRGIPTCSYAAESESDLAQVKYRYDGNATVTEIGRGQFQVEAPWRRVFEPLSVGTEDGLFGDAMPGVAPRQVTVGTTSLSLVYSTFLGGGDEDWGTEIAVDEGGNAYTTGYTYSTDYPTVGPYQENQDGWDVFITKLDSGGDALVYSTYLGGSGGDQGNGIILDSGGNVYVTGYTSSTNFPTIGPYQTYQGDGDAFVAKLSNAGNTLVYSTYLGGSIQDEGTGIAVDGSGNAYITGSTLSPDFPAINPFQAYQGSQDAFVTKLNAVGTAPVYSTCLGGDGYDQGASIAVDSSENAYITGNTGSTNFPTVGPYQARRRSTDVFVTKLATAGDALVYSTYLGGSSLDFGVSIAVDAGGNTYITGSTASTDFPTVGSFQTSHGGGYNDAFVTKMSSAGNSLWYSSYLGGGADDGGIGIAVDGGGNAYVTGGTYSTDFPIVSPCQTARGSADVFVTKVNNAGDKLVYSSYLGGSYDDIGRSIAVDASGDAFVAGTTYSSDFPTINACQTHSGTLDAFVTRLTWQCDCKEQGDINGDGVIDVFDVIASIGVAFSGDPDVQDPGCPKARGDVDNNGVTDVFDVIYLIATAFSGGANPVDPCGS